jgi:opacity protein-like surface antigen
MTRSIPVVLGALLVAALQTTTAAAFDPEQTFQQGTFVLSLEGGGGVQTAGPRVTADGTVFDTGLKLWYFGARASILPFRPILKGTPIYGSLETGLEPIFQRYESPVTAYWAGLTAVARYHFLSLGIFVPYLELGAGPGGTDLRVREIQSDFAFLLFGGVGAQIFLNDSMALYGGYRLVHISNGNTSRPNRGFEAHTGVGGLSFYFK